MFFLVFMAGRFDALHALAARLGYAVRKARPRLSEAENIRLLSPIDEVLADIGISLRSSSVEAARPSVRKEISLLASLAGAPCRESRSKTQHSVDSSRLQSLEQRAQGLEVSLSCLWQITRETNHLPQIYDMTLCDNDCRSSHTASDHEISSTDMTDDSVDVVDINISDNIFFITTSFMALGRALDSVSDCDLPDDTLASCDSLAASSDIPDAQAFVCYLRCFREAWALHRQELEQVAMCHHVPYEGDEAILASED